MVLLEENTRRNESMLKKLLIPIFAGVCAAGLVATKVLVSRKKRRSM